MVFIAGNVVQVGLHVIHQKAQASVKFITVMIGQGRDTNPHHLGNVLMVHAKANCMQYTPAAFVRWYMFIGALALYIPARKQCADRGDSVALVNAVNVGWLTVLYNKAFRFRRHRYAH